MNKELLFQTAKELGIEQLEVYIQTKKTIKIAVYEQEVDSFVTANTTGTAVRGLYKNKVGNTYLEEPIDANIEFVLHKIIENATTISSSDINEFFPGGVYDTLTTYFPAIDESSIEDKIAVLKSVEKNLLQTDSRITKVNHCMYSEESRTISIINTLGLDVHKKENSAAVMVECIASENGDTQSGYEYQIFHDLLEFDEQKLINTLSREVLAKLNSKKVVSNAYPTILRNDVMASILDALSTTFSADMVQKGISIFKDKLNSQIFDSNISIIDNPFLPKGYSTTSFDDEGVPTKLKTIVDRGVLCSFLHNLKTAKKDGVESTGNGFKTSYASGVDIAPTNFFIQAGEHAYETLIAAVKQGVLITEVAGIHAGLNKRTTEFSLQASGFYIENGQLSRPISLITVAGSFTKMMKEISLVGSDLKFDSSGIGAPSILFDCLQISGE